MTEQIQKIDTQNREIEEVFQELDTIAEKLESGDTSLEDSFRLYKKGMELLKYCSDRLDTVEKKMLQMDIVNMAHLGARAFEEIGGEVVQTVAFVQRESYAVSYTHLTLPTIA